MFHQADISWQEKRLERFQLERIGVDRLLPTTGSLKTKIAPTQKLTNVIDYVKLKYSAQQRWMLSTELQNGRKYSSAILQAKG